MVLQTVRLKSDKMATENSTLPVSGEHLDSSVVEDTQNNSVPADGGETVSYTHLTLPTKLEV